jgi:hypothetical protein
VWVGLFVAIGNWVAFGPGEREFTSSISLPFITFSKSGSGFNGGRIAFGIGALLADLVFLGMVYDLVKTSWKEWSVLSHMFDEDDASL